MIDTPIIVLTMFTNETIVYEFVAMKGNKFLH